MMGMNMNAILYRYWSKIQKLMCQRRTTLEETITSYLKEIDIYILILLDIADLPEYIRNANSLGLYPVSMTQPSPSSSKTALFLFFDKSGSEGYFRGEFGDIVDCVRDILTRHSEGQESLRQTLLEQKTDEPSDSCWKCGDGEIDKAFDYRCSYCEKYLCVGCENEYGDCPCQYFAMAKKGEEAADER
jgi:hypothetical protein